MFAEIAAGIILSNFLLKFTVDLTIAFAKKLGSNLSPPSSWRDKFNSVSATDFAFFENQRVSTIIKPALSKYIVDVEVFSRRASIIIVGSLPLAK